MSSRTTKHEILAGLNREQRLAAQHGDDPLLIVAGAGTGKTRTLVHRVALKIEQGVDPNRILLLTFTRRAASEMLRRVDLLLRQLRRTAAGKGGRTDSGKVWGGTFHATASRLLRMYGKSIGLDSNFSILDRGDSEDFLNVLRTELGLAKTDKRFPKKRTCMAIYSHCVNSRKPIEFVLDKHYSWCADYAEDLKRLFRDYVDRKESAGVLDYDDLLLFWRGLLDDPQVGEHVVCRFDAVLVDEYQDTNLLQAEILQLLCPNGKKLTVVGDDAQSIYSFRAATVRNILDFPQQFAGTTIIKLEQNYRSTQLILEATNHVIAASGERHEKNLRSRRAGGERPRLFTCSDEVEQTELMVRMILEHREAGIDLHKQAVLFRASHHSVALEAELARCNIPFVKYGGLKFMETAHVKDLMAFLRLADNPRDIIAGTRVLLLLKGIGPKTARDLMKLLLDGEGDFQSWSSANVPAACRDLWPELVKLLRGLAGASKMSLPAQIQAVLRFYTPLLEEKYEDPDPRTRDLEQIEQLASRFGSRSQLLADFALDPPETTEDYAGTPHLDEDFLVLSTIHSAKGLEWDVVYVIHAADGNIPSDLATGTAEQIEEERRLFYVALTRAKDWLYVAFPKRYYHASRGPRTDRYGYAQLTRFLSDDVRSYFDFCPAADAPTGNAADGAPPSSKRKAIRDQVRDMWSS